MGRSLSRFFAYCVDQAWVTVSLTRFKTKPMDEGKLRVERTSLDLEQAQSLLIHGPGEAASNPHHDRDAIALGLMEVLGLRAGEIVALAADHVTHSTATAPGPCRSMARTAPGAPGLSHPGWKASSWPTAHA